MGRVVLALVVVLSSLGAGAVWARTWHVERDGSGDFTVIQDAVAAASPGDVIKIGPGLYDEYGVYNFGIPGSDWHIYVFVTVPNLTFRGAGPEATFIGPGDGPPNIPRTDGIFAEWIGTLRVEGIGFENLLLRGIDCHDSRLEVADCRFIGPGENGIQGWFTGGLQVTNCEFQGLWDPAILVFDPTNGAVISDCRFVIPQSSVGVKFNYPGSTNCNVRNSTFEGGSVGVSFTSRASGSIIDCVFHEQWNKAIVLDCQMATVVGNTIESTEGTASVCLFQTKAS